MDTNSLWQTVLDDLETQVSKPVFQTFLSKTKLLSVKDKTFTIGCNPPIFINLIEDRYSSIIKKTLDSYINKDSQVVFVAKQPEENQASNDKPLFTLELMEKKKTTKKMQGLNPYFTFENFAVSSSNQMAHAAATAVAKSPGVSYNPLFLYGGVGVGKTHLMQAIGHKVISGKDIRFIYCTGEEFTNEIIEAISTKTTTAFKKKYRRVKMLLIDDVQFIAGKYAIQEEFFHTFNAVSQQRGQIILTSDRPPEEINKLEERLRSRFEGGLTIDIGQPDFELLTAILLIKSKQHEIDLPIELARLVAENVRNPRKLEGVLVRIQTESQIKNLPIDEELIIRIVGRSSHQNKKKKSLNPRVLIDGVASYFQLKISQLKSAKRDRRLALPRQILYYLLKKELGLSLIEIGELLGGRDHTTVLYGVRKINKLVSTDKKIREDILGIKNKVFG